jgi:hypothetical protein
MTKEVFLVAVIRDYENTLKRIRRQLGTFLKNAAVECQRARKDVAMCGCGKDTCQIGNGPGACKPESHMLVEKIEVRV